jgi:hypothetical protein
LKPSRWRAGGAPAWLLPLALLALAAALPAGAADETPAPRTCQVGVYLISLHDFDMTRDTFAADMWLWSTCPTPDLRPLDVADFVNATSVQRSLHATMERGGQWWSYVKIAGVFRENWEVQHYPFDRHILRITLENTDQPASSFSYTPDVEGSKPSRDIRIDGWRIDKFEIAAKTYLYDTIFGDPAFNGEEVSDYARLVISIGITRTKLLSFFKLVTGVYVAVALSMLSFMLGPYNGRRRTNMLVGTLFAVLVNQRVVETVIGRTEEVTLVDEIHLVAMVFIFAIALAGIYSQILFDREQQEAAHRHDRRGLWITAISYVAVNVALIGSAAIRG